MHVLLATPEAGGSEDAAHHFQTPGGGLFVAFGHVYFGTARVLYSWPLQVCSRKLAAF